MPKDTAFQVDIQVDPAFAGQVDESSLHEAVTIALRYEDVPEGTTLTVVIAGDEEVHRLNRQFRQVDVPTDVLAFPTAADGPFVEAPGQPLYLGDVVISQPRAAAQATVVGHSIQAELALLAVHGILHLLGHDHATPEEKAAMWAAQEAILADCELRIEQ